MKLSQRRAKDRATMAALIAEDVRKFPAFTAEIEEITPREIWVHIETPEGARVTVDFDGATCQPDTFFLHWNMKTDSVRKFAADFAPDINTCHWRKATDICESFEGFRMILTKRLQSIADGRAYQDQM